MRYPLLFCLLTLAACDSADPAADQLADMLPGTWAYQYRAGSPASPRTVFHVVRIDRAANGRIEGISDLFQEGPLVSGTYSLTGTYTAERVDLTSIILADVPVRHTYRFHLRPGLTDGELIGVGVANGVDTLWHDVRFVRQ